MSSRNSKQQNHRNLQKTGKKDFSSPNQKAEAQSKPPQPMKNRIAASISITTADECQDEEYPLQVRNLKQTALEQEHTRSAAKEYPGIVKTLLGAVFGSKPDLPSTELERRSEQSRDQLQAEGGKDEQISKSEMELVAELKQKYNQVIQEKQAEWQVKERQLQSQVTHMQDQNQRLNNSIRQIRDELEHHNRILEAKLQETESEKKRIEAEHNLFVRQKQEEEFNRMVSARWLPPDGNEVIGDLDRLKRDMRTLGKKVSTNDMSIFQQLDEADHIALMDGLAEVCTLKNDTLPEGLTSSKSPGLLLNALLSHHIYTTLFKNPFFFLGNKTEDVSPYSGTDNLMQSIYQRMQQANQEEAHIWRSQTLRLLLPPPKNATSQETDLHRWTNELISNVANRQAAKFLEGPARHLIRKDARADSSSKFQTIYQTAAGISYIMWMRRTNMKCHTLKNLVRPVFEPESKHLIPHSSVKYDQFKDQLEGKPISLVIHPILIVCGTNGAKDYDRESVWVPGEVWLDSRKPTK